MADFVIPEALAPVWNDAGAVPKKISDQVGDLVEQLADSGNNGALIAVMQGLAMIDRALVEDRYTDAREWEVAGGALREAFANAPDGNPSGSNILGLMAEAADRARAQGAEEPNTLTAPLLRSISKASQDDKLLGTQWDRERCAAAATVAVAALVGPGALGRVARGVLADLEARMEDLDRLRDAVGSEDAAVRDAARREALPLLIVFMHAMKIRPAVLLERAGWTYEREETGGPGIYLANDGSEGEMFLRDAGGDLRRLHLCDDQEVTSGVIVERHDGPLPSGAEKLIAPPGFVIDGALLSRLEIPDTHAEVELLVAHADAGATGMRTSQVLTARLEPAVASLAMALSQIVGAEQRLYEDAMGCVEAQIAVTEAVIGRLTKSVTPAPEAMQVLADSLLFAERNAYSGLNLLPASKLLERAGFDAAPRADGSAPAVPDLVHMSRPGEAYLLASEGHAAAYLHLADGRRLIFDSEGIFGIKERGCLGVYDPDGAPNHAQAMERHYAEFFALVRVPIERD